MSENGQSSATESESVHFRTLTGRAVSDNQRLAILALDLCISFRTDKTEQPPCKYRTKNGKIRDIKQKKDRKARENGQAGNQKKQASRKTRKSRQAGNQRKQASRKPGKTGKPEDPKKQASRKPEKTGKPENRENRQTGRPGKTGSRKPEP